MGPMVKTPLTVEWSLLGFLNREPMHGYEIYRRLSDHEGLGNVWRLKQSQLYALLSKLENRGYLRSVKEPQTGRPDRKVYHLTEEGRTAFQEWIQRPVERGRSFRMEFLAKLYFAREESDAAIRGLLERQRQACKQWMTWQEKRAASVQETRPYEWLVYRFRIGQVQGMLDWLDACEGLLIPPPST